MFDISFSEILVIAVVALVVVGPERLPAVARTCGRIFGRMRRYLIEIKTDIAREIEIDEIKRAREEFESTKQSIEQATAREADATRKQFEEITSLSMPSRSMPATDPLKPPRK